MENTEKQYEAIFCIINAGFSDDVMFAARKAGAAGGTIIKGRGTAPREAEKMFNIAIQPEKEIVMLLVPFEIKDDVLREIYQAAGLGSPSQGIAFSVPVARAVGLTDFFKKEKEQEKAEEPPQEETT